MQSVSGRGRRRSQSVSQSVAAIDGASRRHAVTPQLRSFLSYGVAYCFAEQCEWQ